MDIAAWLRGLGLERYETAFRDNEIDWAVLPQLTADDLKDIGGQLRQHCPIDFVFPEGDLVSLETQAAQPRRYVHRRLPLP